MSREPTDSRDPIEIIHVEDENAVDEIEQIRRKTFTPELKDLVEKVAFQKKPQEELPEEPETGPERDALMVKLHELFYRSIQLSGAVNVNKSFNPFAPPYTDGEGDLKALTDDVTARMQGLSLEQFAVLSFDDEQKCLTCAFNTIAGADPYNMVIDIDEKLYHDIIKSEYGYSLDSGVIAGDIFLKKRFHPPDADDAGYVLYFLSLLHLHGELITEIELYRDCHSPCSRFFPVIIIKMKKMIQERELFLVMRNNMTFPLIMFDCLTQNSDLDQHNPTPVRSLKDLEPLFMQYSAIPGALILMIRCSGAPDMTSHCIIKYFIVRLERELTGRSAVSYISRNRILIFTDMSEEPLVLRIIGEFNSALNIFQVKKFQPGEHYSFVELLKDVIA